MRFVHLADTHLGGALRIELLSTVQAQAKERPE